jgi:hypothetical protein
MPAGSGEKNLAVQGSLPDVVTVKCLLPCVLYKGWETDRGPMEAHASQKRIDW